MQVKSKKHTTLEKEEIIMKWLLYIVISLVFISAAVALTCYVKSKLLAWAGI
jgi:hypothetical protein